MSGRGNAEQWKREALEAFEASTGYYVNEREDFAGFRAQMEIVLRMLSGEHGDVLDIGCAAGSEIPALRRHGFTVVGAEFSASLLAHAQNRFRGDAGVRFSRADAEFLPFRNGSFDHVTCLGVLEYLSVYDRAIGEIARVLRPGGVAVLSVPNRLSPYHYSEAFARAVAGPVWRSWKRAFGQPRPVPPPVPSHRRNLCIPFTLRQLLRVQGLRPERSCYSGFVYFPVDLFPAFSAALAQRMERFSEGSFIGWTAQQYLISARKTIS
jgi:SAM-dependent methyltransferase